MADVQLNGQSLTTTSATTAPASGASETWTVSALAAGIRTLVTGQKYALVDATPGATPNQQAEIIRVTAATAGGASITVTRGADGTTPVAHAATAVFAIILVASAIVPNLAPDYAFPTAAAPATLANYFDPTHNTYNWKTRLLRKTHAAAGRALDGSGRFDMVVIGDSLMIGYDGTNTTCQTGFEIPRIAMNQLSSMMGGFVNGGSGIQMSAPVAQGANFTERWASTGTVSNTLYSGLTTMYAGSTLTYTSSAVGTAISLYYSDASTQFTVQVDGGSPVTITPGGLQQMMRYQVTGLASGTHSIKVNCSTNWVFITGAMVDVPGVGAKVHNLSIGGGAAGTGDGTRTYTTNWTDNTGTAGGMANTRKAMLTLEGITAPDLVVVHLGGNDLQNAASATNAINAIAGLTTIKGWWPNADFVLLSSIRVGPNTTEALWVDFKARVFQWVDQNDVLMVDYQDRAGVYETYVANGGAGGDTIHPKNATALDWGKQLGSLLAA